MKRLLRQGYAVCSALALATAMGLWFAPQPAIAGTTGIIQGTVTDASGAPLADVKVTASSPTQNASTTTNATGFYSIVDLSPDTYTISFQKEGYASLTIPGIAVFQDETAELGEKLSPQLKTIATVRASSSSNLVKPNQGSDVYTVSGAQLSAATNPGNLHETLYQWLNVVPGVTQGSFNGQPRVRGGQVTDLGYEFDGITIQDRIVGFFTTNLANIGIGNIEVYTGGLSAADSFNGTGFFNVVAKRGSYPGYTDLFTQVSSPEMNNYLTFERGYATPNHKFDYYIGFDGVNSRNYYDNGIPTFPNVLFWGYDGPGQVKTRDWVANFHYDPDPKNDIQVLWTNSLGEFIFNYLLAKSPGAPPNLDLIPCPGATYTGNGFSGGSGGTAPNGQTCPAGLYFGTLNPGTGNIWHHYGSLGKIQWNHNINDHSFFSLHFDENFNQYIFDQQLAEANLPNLENGAYNWASCCLGLPASACPPYPYQAGTPVQIPQGDPFDLCMFDDGIETFYGDRRSNIFQGALDYTNAVSAKATIKAGVSNEYDNNVFAYYNTATFSPNGSYPGYTEQSTYPTRITKAYLSAELHVGKFLLSPGLGWGQMHYAFPAVPNYPAYGGRPSVPVPPGGASVSVLNPTFNGTYTLNPTNVLRFSYGDTASFISSAYVFTSPLSASYDMRNPAIPGTSFNPQRNISGDLMWEHQFAPNTSLRFGPFFNRAFGYFESFRPVIGTLNGHPVFAKYSILQNNQKHNNFGLELGLNHLDYNKRGWSYWLAATYQNYWTTSFNLAGAFINSPLPSTLVNRGIYVRAFGNGMFNGTITTDYHSDRFHFDPQIFYQSPTFYNTGDISFNKATNDYEFNTTELKSSGYWNVTLKTYEELGPKRNLLVGMTVNNLLDNKNDVNPCPSDGTGCFPFDGPQSGVNVGGDIYQQTYTQSPRLFYFWAGVRM